MEADPIIEEAVGGDTIRVEDNVKKAEWDIIYVGRVFINKMHITRMHWQKVSESVRAKPINLE